MANSVHPSSNIRVGVFRQGLPIQVLLGRLGSQLLLVGALVAAIFSLDATNTDFGAVQYPVIKYLPIILAFASILLNVLSGRIGRRIVQDPVSYVVLAYLFYVLAGSSYTVFILHHKFEASFFGRGINAVAFFAGALVFARGREKTYFMARYITLLYWLGVIVALDIGLFAMGLIYPELPQVHHIEVIFVGGMAILGIAHFRRKGFRAMSLILAAIGVILSGKATGRGVGIIASLGLAYVFGRGIGVSRAEWKGILHRRKKSIAIASVFIAVVGIGVIGEIVVHRIESRSVEVRATTYAERLAKFSANPVLGEYFVGSPILEVGPLLIPSHSDLMDILSFGGLVGFLLFMTPVVIGLRRVVRRSRRSMMQSRVVDVYFAATLVMFLGAMSVNPVLSYPRVAFFYWLTIAYCVSAKWDATLGHVRWTSVK
jgi:hypothetical protein